MGKLKCRDRLSSAWHAGMLDRAWLQGGVRGPVGVWKWRWDECGTVRNADESGSCVSCGLVERTGLPWCTMKLLTLSNLEYSICKVERARDVSR